MLSSIPVACNRDCGGGCALLAQVEDGRLVRMAANPAGGPYMEACVRGYQMPRTLYAPDRLRRPLLRSGPRGSGLFREAGWDEALDLVARRLADVRDRYGAQSILNLSSAGACRGALHNTLKLPARFLNLFGGCTSWRGSYSSQAVNFVLPYVLGTTQAGVDAATLQFSRLIVLWGANVADCRHGSETAARIREAQRRGTPVVVIDPRRTRSVTAGATWLPIRPGGDAALLLAVLYVLFDEELVDRVYMARCCMGADQLEAYVRGAEDGRPKTPAWAAPICGLTDGQIVDFARLYGRSRPVALLAGLAIQRTLGGEDAARLAIALQAVTGNLGVPGGTAGANLLGVLPGPRAGSLPVPPSADQPWVQVTRWPDAVLQGRQGGYPTDIHAIYNVGGNYLAQGADVRQNMAAFAAVEFAVTHDYFLTPTARFCDVVLPATTFLERQDVVSAPGNCLLFSNRAVRPLGAARSDYDIFCDLADRLGFGARFSEGKGEEAWLRSFVAASDVPDYEAFRQTGVYLAPERGRTAFADFIADPKAHPLATPSGRIEIASAAYAQDTGFPALPEYRPLPIDPAYPLQMITPKSRYRVHSQGANIPWFNAREPQAAWLHRADAAARGIADGQPVLITSPEGAVRITARVTADIVPGAVCLLEGMWPRFDGPGAAESAGRSLPGEVDSAGCANVLTSNTPTLPSHGSRTHTVFVEVVPAG